jgi:hypothetical protein
MKSFLFLRFVISSVLFLQSAEAQRPLYDETYFGNYLPSPPSRGCSCYVSDTFGSRIKRDDSIGLDFIDSSLYADIHWERIYIRNRIFFQTRFSLNNTHLLSKYIQVSSDTNGLANLGNFRDSAYIYYTYDSSSGRYQSKTILTRLVFKKKPYNHTLKTYYYDSIYRPTLVSVTTWDTTNKIWVNTAKDVPLYPKNRGTPDFIDHYLFSKALIGWVLVSRDSIFYDSAVNPVTITKFIRKGVWVDSSMRTVRYPVASPGYSSFIEKTHWIWDKRKWIKDTVLIEHYTTYGILSRLFKRYDPATQLCIHAIKCKYANPNYEDIDDEQKEISAINLSIYPNPAYGPFSLQYNLPASGPIHILITDMFGRLVRDVVNKDNEQKGEHTLTIESTGMAPGIYNTTIITRDNTETKRLVILK